MMQQQQQQSPLYSFMYALKSSEARRQYPKRLKMLFDYLKLAGPLEEQAIEFLDISRQEGAQCRRCPSKSGSLYLHCDWHASHYLKLELDKIFGYNKFRNEIVWKRHNAHNDGGQGSRLLGRIHDVILFYTKSHKYTWNPVYQPPYSHQYIKKYYNHVEPETGRPYAYGDMSGPGGRM